MIKNILNIIMISDYSSKNFFLLVSIMTIPPHPSLNLYSYENLSKRIKLPIKKIQKIIKTQSSQVTIFPLEKINNEGLKKIRIIYSPSPEYKSILRKINKYLFANHTYPTGVCGGIKGKTLIDMVKGHCQKEAIYSVDIKNFYPSISKERVFNFFKRCNCNKKIASILSEITTFENHLPQGFPTSTLLSNLVLFNTDVQHMKLAEKHNLYRTRWIDDIVFSGRIMDLEKAKPKIDTVIKSNNFKISKNKSKFVRREDSPEAVGLVINKKNPYIPQGFIDRVEEIINIASTYDLELVKDLYNFTGNNENIKKSIKGKILFIEKYNPIDAMRLKGKFNKIT